MTEANDFYEVGGLVLLDQDVFGGEVAMIEPPLMKILNCFQDLFEDGFKIIFYFFLYAEEPVIDGNALRFLEDQIN